MNTSYTVHLVQNITQYTTVLTDLKLIIERFYIDLQLVVRYTSKQSTVCSVNVIN